jgi:hypothetical protein
MPAVQRVAVGLLIIVPTTVATIWAVRWVAFRKGVSRQAASVGDHNIASYGQVGGITAHTVHGAADVEPRERRVEET